MGLSMARKNANESRRVEFRISAPSYERLEFLAKKGLYGGSVGEVARMLVGRELDDLTRANVLPLDLPEA